MNNIVYYRIPSNTGVKVTFNSSVLFNDVFPVGQFGKVTGVSVYKAGVLFDPLTGVPVRILKY